MNAVGDDYVSFNPMHITISPDERHLLISTGNIYHFSFLFDSLPLSSYHCFSSSFFRKDKDRLILYDWSTGRVVTSLYGASNDEYSQPRHCWHPNGQYIYGVREREREVIMINLLHLLPDITG